MNLLYERCAGLDVHKRNVLVCVTTPDSQGQRHKERRTFSPMTPELLRMRHWLQDLGVRHVAMESTGVFWKPIFNILEGHMEVLVVNAQHLKAVPGRKTDVKDAEWIADLLAGEVDPSVLAQLARGRMRAKRDLLEQALQGLLKPHHRFLLSEQLADIDALDEAIEHRSAEIAQRFRPYEALLRRLETIPGISLPGPGCALATTRVRANGSPAGRGGKKGTIALGHTLVVIIYQLLSEDKAYAELGGNYFAEWDRQAVKTRLVRRLEKLGYQVKLEPASPAM
jgi:transposase